MSRPSPEGMKWHAALFPLEGLPQDIRDCEGDGQGDERPVGELRGRGDDIEAQNQYLRLPVYSSRRLVCSGLDLIVGGRGRGGEFIEQRKALAVIGQSALRVLQREFIRRLRAANIVLLQLILAAVDAVRGAGSGVVDLLRGYDDGVAARWHGGGQSDYG